MKQDPFKKSDATFRKIIENIPSGVLTLDKDWQVVYLNRTAERMLFRRRRQLLGKNIWQVFPEAVNNAFYRAYHEAVQKQENVQVEGYSAALSKWTQAAIYPSPDGISVYFQDVTGQRLAEKKAREGELKYRQLLDRITDGFIALDKDFRYTYANQTLGKMVHRDPASLIGKGVWEEFPDAVGSYTYRAFQTAMKEQRFISNIDHYPPLNLWQENYIYPSPEGLSVLVKDITEQKKLELELKQRERQQQQRLYATALQVQEKERTRIGRELHDNVGQLLTAAKLMISSAKHSPGEAAELIERGIAILTKALDETRNLAHELVPPHFSPDNFTREIAGLFQSMLSAKGIETVVDAADFSVAGFPGDVQLTLYRIIQEQCTNIIKYANATTVSIRLHTSTKGLTLEVTDNGRGTDQTEPKGIGLANMRARLALFDGTLAIESEKGRGFTLRAEIPKRED